MKTASVSETRQNLSPLLNWIKETNKDVVIQNRGEAEAVIIPISDYELLREARENRRRREAIAELMRIAAEVGKQNEGLSAAETAVIADEITREALGSLITQGKVKFQD